MQQAMPGKINAEAAVKIVVLLGFAVFFSFIILTDRVRLYVHPRIVPAMLFAIPAMALIAASTFKELFRPTRRFNIVPYLFFVIPLALAFTLPATSMDSSSMSFGDINLTRHPKKSTALNKKADTGPMSLEDGQEEFTEEQLADIKVTSENYEALAALAKKPDNKGLRLRNGMVVMDDRNFYRWMNELYENMEKYRGKKIQVVGFVFRDDTIKGDEFVPARLLMVCCTADLQTVGLLCRYDNAKALERDSWVKVTGTIRIIDFKGERIPTIDVDNVIPTDKPKSDYIYPF